MSKALCKHMRQWGCEAWCRRHWGLHPQETTRISNMTCRYVPGSKHLQAAGA